MNVLYLPNNVASMPALTALGMSGKDNVSVKVITQSTHKFITENKLVVNFGVSRRHPIKWFINKITFKRKIKKLIEWADVVHYFWGPLYSDFSDLEYCKKLNKLIFVEWVGSDIRNPDILKPINPFYSNVFDNGYEYSEIESSENSYQIQNKFASYGAIPFLCPEMSMYLNRELFSNVYIYNQRQSVDTFKPQYPNPIKKRPLIIHSPSAPNAKGTPHIIQIIDELRKDLDFEFKLIHGIPREELLEIMAEADIYIDQMICGSYGMAATEAMSLGKPVVTYIMPEVFESGLDERCPIINGGLKTLKQDLTKIIKSGSLRNSIGIKSREFAQQFHDTNEISNYIYSVYQHELDRKAK